MACDDKYIDIPVRRPATKPLRLARHCYSRTIQVILQFSVNWRTYHFVAGLKTEERPLAVFTDPYNQESRAQPRNLYWYHLKSVHLRLHLTFNTSTSVVSRVKLKVLDFISLRSQRRLPACDQIRGLHNSEPDLEPQGVVH